MATGAEVRDEAGVHSFTVGGLDSMGWPFPASTYALELLAYVPGTDVHGQTSTTLTVDRDPPAVGDISAARARSPTARRLPRQRADHGHAVRARIAAPRQAGPRGRRRRRLRLGSTVAGQFTSRWDGHTPWASSPSPAATGYEVVAWEKAANHGVTGGGRIRLLSGH